MNKQILMFSGGLDSFIGYYYLNKPLCVHVDLGTGYSKIEKASCVKLSNKYQIDVIFTELRDVGFLEKSNAEIPMRNLFLAMMGSQFGDNIWFVFQRGETHNESNDRSPSFCKKAGEILSHLHHRMKRVDSPFWALTKTQMVKWFVDRYEPKILYDTFSCYTPINNKPCGNCNACFRRAMAFQLNDMESDVKLKRKILLEYRSKFKKGIYSDDRKRELKEFLKLRGVLND